MSKDYEGQDPLAFARQAERDLNSHQAKHGVSAGDSSNPSRLLPQIPPKYLTSHRLRRRHQRNRPLPRQHHQSRLRGLRRRRQPRDPRRRGRRPHLQARREGRRGPVSGAMYSQV